MRHAEFTAGIVALAFWTGLQAQPAAPAPTVASVERKVYQNLDAPAARTVPSFDQIMLAARFQLPASDYLEHGNARLMDVILSLTLLDVDGEFRVVLHTPAKEDSARIGEEVVEIFRGKARDLGASGDRRRTNLNFDWARGVVLRGTDYYVVLHGLSGVPSIAWNTTDQAASEAKIVGARLMGPSVSQVDISPGGRDLSVSQLARSIALQVPNGVPDSKIVNFDTGASLPTMLPLALQDVGTFMMEVSVRMEANGPGVPEPGTYALLLGTAALAGVALHRRARPMRH